MKKITILTLTAVGIVISIGLFIWNSNRPSSVATPEVAVQEQLPRVSLVIDTSQKVATYTGIQAKTAYDALQYVVQQQNIELKTKQYDFGIFVQAIEDKVSGNDKAWIFFVNNVSATEAADRTVLREGDSVSWRYIKPMIE